MNRFASVTAALVVLLLVSLSAAAPASALEVPAAARGLVGSTVLHQDGHGAEPTTIASSGKDVSWRVKWMITGIAVSAYALSMLYLLKKRLGGFPENPGWVAPITIMPSSELPGDNDPHGADSHGHAAAPGH